MAALEDNIRNHGQNDVAGEEVPEVSTIEVTGGESFPETTAVDQDVDPQAIAKPSRRGRPKTADLQDNGNAKSKQTAEQIRRGPITQSGSDPPEDDISNQGRQQRISRARSRRSLENRSTAEVVPGVGREPEPEESVPESSSFKRGRRRKEPEQQDENENNEPTQTAPRGRRKRGRPSTVHVEVEENEEEETSQNRSKRKGKNREVEPDERPSVDETQERSDETRKEDKARRKQPHETGEGSRRRGRPSLGKGQESQPGAEATETRAEASGEPNQPTRRRRRRPSAGATEDSTTSGQRTKRPREQDGNQEPRRHEGTVAITVHRLTNTQILDHAASDASDDEQDSTDELEAVGKKFPSRNGVNAADVLSQICKEILDKHLTTLENNIANDAANQAKRSEYARQRKTIEAYGTQLEGRLFELSEMLDSNFSLGVQLKRAKREAVEMRNRLLEIRQQRHEITLRMDAVRRKHGEEEDAKMVSFSYNHVMTMLIDNLVPQRHQQHTTQPRPRSRWESQ